MGLFNKKELQRITELENQITDLKVELFSEKNKSEKLGISKYEEAVALISKAELESKNKIDLYVKEQSSKLDELNSNISKSQTDFIAVTNTVNDLNLQVADLSLKEEKLNNQVENQQKKLARTKELYKALLNAYDYDERDYDYSIADKFVPSIIARINCLNYQDLRKEYKANEKNIDVVLEKYEKRYTTKANKTIYSLLVMALQSELQNILNQMKYDKLESAITTVKELCLKFVVIISDGNQSIAPTVKKFIGEIEYLFINAINIEYEYYIKKEREKEEQAAIREQIKQEAEEKRILDQQRKQVEVEESKYLTEMDNVKEQISNTTDETKLLQLEKKIKDLQEKILQVEEKKEEIISRQNGKAGNVYVISNLGAFGENMFKVGMTRRLEPMDRVKELGDASVPFGFDVHAMIFSDDAVSLENKIHKILDKCRVNKVNLRKEFFYSSVDEIEKIVLEEDPSAEFVTTMLAEQYRQSLSIAEENN